MLTQDSRKKSGKWEPVVHRAGNHDRRRRSCCGSVVLWLVTMTWTKIQPTSPPSLPTRGFAGSTRTIQTS